MCAQNFQLDKEYPKEIHPKEYTKHTIRKQWQLSKVWKTLKKTRCSNRHGETVWLCMVTVGVFITAVSAVAKLATGSVLEIQPPVKLDRKGYEDSCSTCRHFIKLYIWQNA